MLNNLSIWSVLAMVTTGSFLGCSRESSQSSKESETESVSQVGSTECFMRRITCDMEADSLKPGDDSSEPGYAHQHNVYLRKQMECSRIRCENIEFKAPQG